MVALAEPKEIIEDKPTRVLRMPLTGMDRIRSKAAEHGHEIWRKEALDSGFVAGFPDDKANRIRSGLLPYDIISNIHRMVESSEANNPQEIKDKAAINTAELLLMEMDSGNIKVSPEIESALQRIKKKQSPEDILLLKEWMWNLATDWYFRNDNWADVAEKLVQVASEISSSNPGSAEFLTTLRHIKAILADIDNSPDFKSIVDKIKKMKITENFPVSKLLIDIHAGWRSKTGGDVAQIERDLSTALNSKHIQISIILREFKKYVANMASYLNVDSKKLGQMINKNMETWRSDLEKKLGVSGATTYALIIQLGEALQEVLQENPQLSDRAKEGIRLGMEGATFTLKQDVDAEMIDIILETYEN